MTFSEEAAELHRLEAVALSLGLTERAFEDILLAVVAAGHASGKMPKDQLAEIGRQIHEAADCRTLVETGPRASILLVERPSITCVAENLDPDQESVPAEGWRQRVRDVGGSGLAAS